MSILTIAAIVIIGFVVALVLIKNKVRSQEFPYQLSKCLLSKAERSFYGVLTQAVGSNGLVFSKVRVADVITPGNGLNRSDWQRAFNAVSAKHFDFLVCDPRNCAVRLAVELDDASHGTKKGQRRDRLLNTACRSAGLPLLRVDVAKGYVVADIRTQVERAMSQPDVATAAQTAPEVEKGLVDQRESPSVIVESAMQARNHTLTSEARPATAPPQCPKCGQPMLRRRATSGRNLGKDFWGCSAFPKCRGIMTFSA